VTRSAPLVERLEPAGDPAELAAALLDLPYPIFLDSATGLAAGEPHQLGRYSFLSADPVLVLRSKGQVTEVLENGRGRRVQGDALGVIREVLRDWAGPAVPGLPPFQGGAAGYIGYDYGAVLERVPPPTWCSASTIGSSPGTTARARHG
jgi:para-aminobenzoate synthetase component I